MTRVLSAIALTLALAGSAAAQEVRINVVGKDDAAVRADIRQAVEQVCQTANRAGQFQGAYTVQNCLMDGQTRALAQYKAYQRDASTQVTALASNGASSSSR
jgi:hypothetical protein